MIDYTGAVLPDLGFSKESYYEENEDYGTLDLYDLSSDAVSYASSIQTLLRFDFDFDFENAIQAKGIDDEGEFIPFEETDTPDDVYYGYIVGTKEFISDTGDIYAIATVEATIMSAEMVYDLNGEDAINAYPDGIVSFSFAMESYSTYTEVCNELSSLLFPDDFVLGSFGFNKQPGMFSIESMDDYGWIYGCDYYFRVYNTRFDDAETALEQIAVSESYLNSLGLSTYEGYSANDLANGTAEYVVLDKVFSDGSILEIQMSADEEGGVGIALMY